MPSHIDLALLRTFVVVVECGGFSRAAGRLMRGQSAVSLQIKRLEDRLGVRLLERGPRRVLPTVDGERLLEHARRMLALNDDLVARFEEENLGGLVRLGAPEDFATSHLAGVLERFSRDHQSVALEVTCELTLDILERFGAGGLDIALVKREPGVEVGGRRVWRERLVWVGAGRSSGEAGKILSLVVSPRPCVYRKRATTALDAVGRPWRIAYTCGSLAGSHAAVRAGLGVTVLPRDMVPSNLAVLDEEVVGLPDLADTEMALIEAPQLGPAAIRLRDDIIRELGGGAT